MPNVGSFRVFDVPTLPPPAVGVRFRPKKILKRAGKIAKKGVKIYVAPIKIVAKAGKAALMAAARLAARPIKSIFRKLANRRARYLSWKNRKSLQPNPVEKVQAVTWSLHRMRSKGPIGALGVKILRFTGGATVGNLRGGALVGVEAATITSAAVAIVAATKQIMSSLNKPGEAPADPRKGEESEEEESAGWGLLPP